MDHRGQRRRAGRGGLAAGDLRLSPVPADADQPRQPEPGAARTDQRHPGDPRLHSRGPRVEALRGRQRGRLLRHAARLPLDGAAVPDRHVHGEHLIGRGDLVRRLPHRLRQHSDRPDDRLPELPNPDPHLGDDVDDAAVPGAALRGVGGPHPGGARHRTHGGSPRRPGRPAGADGRRRVPRRHLHLPGCGGSGAGEPVVHAGPGPHHRDHRVDGIGQVHPGEPDPPPVRRQRRRGAGGRRRRAPPRSRCPVVADRAGATETLPVLRDGGLQPALRAPRRHTGADVGGAADRPGSRFRRETRRRSRRPHRAGRHERLGRAA